MCCCLRGVSRWFTPLACGPGSPELSKSYMDVASTLFALFTSLDRVALTPAMGTLPCGNRAVPWV